MIFSIISKISSLTPGIVAKACFTFANLTPTKATPSISDNRILLSALPTVIPWFLSKGYRVNFS